MKEPETPPHEGVEKLGFKDDALDAGFGKVSGHAGAGRTAANDSNLKIGFCMIHFLLNSGP